MRYADHSSLLTCPSPSVFTCETSHHGTTPKGALAEGGHTCAQIHSNTVVVEAVVVEAVVVEAARTPPQRSSSPDSASPQSSPLPAAPHPQPLLPPRPHSPAPGWRSLFCRSSCAAQAERLGPPPPTGIQPSPVTEYTRCTCNVSRRGCEGRRVHPAVLGRLAPCTSQGQACAPSACRGGGRCRPEATRSLGRRWGRRAGLTRRQTRPPCQLIAWLP